MLKGIYGLRWPLLAAANFWRKNDKGRKRERDREIRKCDFSKERSRNPCGCEGARFSQLALFNQRDAGLDD